MFYLFASTTILVFLIGIFMVAAYRKGGWLTPPVLSGIAFILLSLPALVRLYYFLTGPVRPF